MKWNILIGSLVLSMAVSTQGFSFDLLDQMLSAGGCGCASSCCDAKPACGCQAKPVCGCEAKPACGCQPKCHRRRGILDGILGCHSCKKACGCDAKPVCGCEAKPVCGCEAEPACGCQPKCCKPKCHGGLLDGILGCLKIGCGHCGGCGCEVSCGCGVEAASEAPSEAGEGDVAPMPPAPVVDPSAFIPSQQKVVKASKNVVR